MAGIVASLTVLGLPLADTTIYPGDNRILYGRAKTLKNLNQQEAGAEGEAQHAEAVIEQKKKDFKA